MWSPFRRRQCTATPALTFIAPLATFVSLGLVVALSPELGGCARRAGARSARSTRRRPDRRHARSDAHAGGAMARHGRLRAGWSVSSSPVPPRPCSRLPAIPMAAALTQCGPSPSVLTGAGADRPRLRTLGLADAHRGRSRIVDDGARHEPGPDECRRRRGTCPDSRSTLAADLGSRPRTASDAGSSSRRGGSPSGRAARRLGRFGGRSPSSRPARRRSC